MRRSSLCTVVEDKGGLDKADELVLFDNQVNYWNQNPFTRNIEPMYNLLIYQILQTRKLVFQGGSFILQSRKKVII